MRLRTALALLIALTRPCAALAGGALLYETGTPEVGLASAGWAARAEDAATILTNPAGMTRVKKPDLMLGLQALYADVEFTPNDRTTTTGGNGGNPIGWFPGGGVYYVHPTTENLRLGIAVTGNFGLGLKYDDDWVGRYYVESATLLGISVLPAIAWKINDKVSIGAALNAMYGVSDNKVAVNNILPATPDGTLKLNDNTWGFGGNIGVLYEPRSGTRLGLTYTSPVKLDFGAVPEFSNLAPGLAAALQTAGLLNSKIDISMTVPQTVMTSVVHDVNDRWTILANLGWQDWSAFGKVNVGVVTDNANNPTSLTANLNFKDTWHAALGARVQTKSPWSVSFGTAYDSSCVDDADRTPSLPLGAAWRFGVGARRPVGKKLDLGIAYELLWGGSLPLDQTRGPLSGTITGSYENTSMHFLTASLRWSL